MKKNDTSSTNASSALDWGAKISTDEPERIIPAEGDYRFTVTELKRGYYNGGSKLPACNKATLKLEVETDKGTATAYVTLYLDKSMEWKLSSFFRSIGQKKVGEEITMDWEHVVGASGRAHFRPQTYKDNDGHEKQYIEVNRFLDCEPDATLPWLEAPKDTPFGEN